MRLSNEYNISARGRIAVQGRLVIGTVVGLIVAAAGGTWIQNAVAVPLTYGIYETPTTAISDPLNDEMMRRLERPFLLDRYGNRIEPAIGDYRIDSRGDVFERHSPSTAIPRLPDPSV
jgi:hypothetical protein